MAYQQDYYQAPQRPYNGRAAQRPGPPQGYNQSTPQQYPQQQYDQYDQYGQDGYGYDEYNNGYDQGYDGGYNDMNGGGRGNGYPPPSQQNYPPQRPPQQEYYGSGQGRGMPPPRGGGRGGPPMQRPPTADGPRGYGAPPGPGRGYPNGGPGRGGRPAPMDRNPSSDPGQRPYRKPLKTPPPLSPEGPVSTFDNPFPTFPGTKKKTARSEEQDIVQKMANVEIGPPPNKSKRGGSKGSNYANGPTDDWGRPSMDGQRPPPTDDWGRPSMDGQRRPGPGPNGYGRHSEDNQRRPSLDEYGRGPGGNGRGIPPGGYPPRGPPQQGFQPQRRGPPQGPGYGGPRQNGYGDTGFDESGSYMQDDGGYANGDFGPPERSMTMPNKAPPMEMGRQPPMQRPMEAPYNGPIGRGMPPRPSTATGARSSPQRQRPDQPDLYANGSRRADSQGYDQHQSGSIDDFYDSYYDTPDEPQRRHHSLESEMPNFDAVPTTLKPGHRRGASIDEHIQPAPQQNYGQQIKPVKSQPDIRGQAQPQAAVFEMAHDAPPLPESMPHPNSYPQQGYDDGYGGAQNGWDLNPGPAFVPYDSPPAPQDAFQGPPRNASTAPRGLPSGPRSGLPNGPSPRNGPPRQSPGNPDALPSHPPPVRAGLIPGSVANLASNKPTPVRNYNGVAPPPQQTPPQQSSSQGPPSQNGAKQKPEADPPVTIGELERLRNTVRAAPNDQDSQMLLVRKLVEASEVIVPTIADQKSRNKTREKYVMDATKHLRKLVQLGNVEAMFYLADCYGRGALGLETDNKEAFSLYQSAAKAGHAAAAYRTAVCCELGNEDGGGTRKDPLKAIQWYKRAATLGDTPAMYKMGMIQLKGLLGQQRNPREAVGWLKRAADRADAENPHALHELGLLYEAPQGDGSIMRDEAYSFRLFQQAADLGYKFSQFRLGCAFEYGLFNCPIDPRQSIMWYSRAAAQEEHQSELALSGWYLTGSEGVLQQSDTEAYLWARKAAMAGLAKAEYAMGYFTEVGIGSPANLEDAKRWYWRAAAQNFPKARERLEDLKKGGSKASLKSRERISRSKVGKQNEGDCSIM